MRQIILLLSLLPILAVFLCKKWFVDKGAKASKMVKINQSPNDVVTQALVELGMEHVEIKSAKRRWSGNAPVGEDWITLPSESSAAHTAYTHGKAVLHLGLLIILKKDPTSIKRRNWAVRFGYVFPIFVTIIIVFACAVAKMQILWGISAIMLSLGAASCAQLLTLMANLQAVDLASVILEKKRIYPRLHEEESVIRAAKSSAWAGLIPGVLARFI